MNEQAIHKRNGPYKYERKVQIYEIFKTQFYQTVIFGFLCKTKASSAYFLAQEAKFFLCVYNRIKRIPRD